MKNVTYKAVILMTTILLSTPFVANAEEPTCTMKEVLNVYMPDLQEAIKYSIFEIDFRRADDTRKRLNQKAIAALTKLGEFKLSDAIDKLVDITDKVEAMEGDGARKKRKITEASASAITTASSDATSCIYGIMH